MPLAINDVLELVDSEWITDTNLFDQLDGVSRSEFRSTIAAGLRSKVLVARRQDGQRWLRVASVRTERLRFPDCSARAEGDNILLTFSLPGEIKEILVSTMAAENFSDMIAAAAVGLRGIIR